jgi:hypothetical protein
MQRKGEYSVVVGNIGTVYRGNNYVDACKVYGVYKRLSHAGVGRAGGEPVVLCDEQGDPVLEYAGAGGE